MNSTHAALADTARDPGRVWASGKFARVGAHHVLAHELLAHSVDVHAGHRVLDVGTGTGNAALAAARRGAVVTAVDLVGDSLAIAEDRARGEGFGITTQVADAQELPFPDGAFDIVLSTFAVMFAPDSDAAAAELVRVCRPGGRIGLTTWTPDGYVGQTMSTLSRYQAAPGGSEALKWSDDEWLRQTFAGSALDVRNTRRTVDMCLPSPKDAIEFYRETLGPFRATLEGLDPEAQQALIVELSHVMARFNTATDGTLVMPAEYVETIVRKTA